MADIKKYLDQAGVEYLWKKLLKNGVFRFEL